MKLTATHVLERFRLIRPSFDMDIPMTSPTPAGMGFSEPHLAPENVLADLLQRIEDQVKGNPAFSSGEYDWATDPSVYRDYAEAMMQYDLLTVLGEMRRDRPGVEALQPIAIKWVTNPYFASVCVPGPDLNFILLSHGFAKFLQVVVGTMVRLHDLAAESTVPPSGRSNYLLGADIERALRLDDEAVRHALHVLIGSAMRSMDGELVGMDNPVTPRLVELGDKHPFLATIYSSAELFIVLHEVAHLLLEQDPKKGRTLKQEIDADHAGQSLLIVADATLGYAGPYIVGPAFYFQVARLYEMIRRFLRKDESLQAEQEMQSRLKATIARAPGMGMPLESLIQCMAEEVFVLIAGCQHEMLRMLKSPVPLDSLLPPITSFDRSGVLAKLARAKRPQTP